MAKKFNQKKAIVTQSVVKNNPASSNKKDNDPSYPGWIKPVLYLVLFIFAFILYGKTRTFSYVMDDDIATRLNKFVAKGFEGIPDLISKGSLVGFSGENTGTYRPASLVMLAIETELWGLNPKTFHTMNVFLYGLTGIALFSLLMKLFKTSGIYFLFGITLLFISHPIHTEVVANIKSRDEIMGLFFNLLTCIFVLKYLEKKSILFALFGIASFTIACFSKENAIVFVAIVPLTLYFFTEYSYKKILSVGSILLCIGLFYLLVRSSILDNNNSEMEVINNSLAGAKNSLEFFATNMKIMLKYLGLLTFPIVLSWDYSFNQIPISDISDPVVIASVLLFLTLGVYSIIRFRHKDIFAYCIIFYILMMLPVSNFFIQIASTMAERFLYTPSIAFCLFLGAGVSWIAGNKAYSIMSPKKNIPIILLVFLLVSIVYSIKTLDRVKDWKDNISLFESGIKTSPNSARTHTSLAYEYGVQADLTKDPEMQKMFRAKAAPEFETGLAIYPDFPDGWYQLGYTYYLLGDYDNAYKAYLKTIEIKPDYFKAYNNIGVIYFIRKEYNKALEYFIKAVEINEEYDEAIGNIGAVHHNLGNRDEAIKYYTKALEKNPNLTNVRSNLDKLTQPK